MLDRVGSCRIEGEIASGGMATVYLGRLPGAGGFERLVAIKTMHPHLAAEEAFIYDLNRFNVLTSRAKQKMLLLCSRTFLDYIPGDRDIMPCASREVTCTS